MILNGECVWSLQLLSDGGRLTHSAVDIQRTHCPRSKEFSNDSILNEKTLCLSQFQRGRGVALLSSLVPLGTRSERCIVLYLLDTQVQKTVTSVENTTPRDFPGKTALLEVGLCFDFEGLFTY